MRLCPCPGTDTGSTPRSVRRSVHVRHPAPADPAGRARGRAANRCSICVEHSAHWTIGYGSGAVGVVAAVAGLSLLEQGRRLHGQVAEHGAAGDRGGWSWAMAEQVAEGGVQGWRQEHQPAERYRGDVRDDRPDRASDEDRGPGQVDDRRACRGHSRGSSSGAGRRLADAVPRRPTACAGKRRPPLDRTRRSTRPRARCHAHHQQRPCPLSASGSAEITSLMVIGTRRQGPVHGSDRWGQGGRPLDGLLAAASSCWTASSSVRGTPDARP